MLGALGLTVIISDCSNHQKLINYLSDYKIKRLGIVIGVHELLEIIINKYENNLDGNLLTAFGELFSRNIKVYAYPALEKEGDKMLFVDNLPIPDGIKFLFQHLIENDQITQVQNYNEDILHIIPAKVFKAIKASENGTWEDSLPEGLAKIIKEKSCFGYGANVENFIYDKSPGNDAEYY
jgi:hypothetical protein